jgi:hypothetical protein
MAKKLVLNHVKKLVEEMTGEIFKGVAPRDLNEGDTFEQMMFDGSVKRLIIAEKKEVNGLLIVRSEVV